MVPESTSRWTSGPRVLSVITDRPEAFLPGPDEPSTDVEPIPVLLVVLVCSANASRMPSSTESTTAIKITGLGTPRTVRERERRPPLARQDDLPRGGELIQIGRASCRAREWLSARA